MSAEGADLLVDAVDAVDRVVGIVRRGDVLALGINFRVVHVFVFNRNRELLLQHIARGLRHEGSWGSSAAGFVQTGETYEAAAVRKLAVELSTVAPVTAVGRTSMLDGTSTKFIGVYEATHDGPFIADPKSASELEFLPITEIMARRHSGSRAFTPTFLTVLDFYREQVSGP